jgi:hypothetical protein
VRSPRVEITCRDVETGEVREGVPILVPQKHRNGFGQGWFAVANDALNQLATSSLTGVDFRVLLMCLSKLQWDNHLIIVQRELADALGLTSAQVSTSMRRLVEIGVILRERQGGARLYRLNPQFGWKGSAKAHRKAQAGRFVLHT